MPQTVNYQRLLDDIIRRLDKSGDVPTLLLHCCCAPCSSYVLEYLSNYFRITTFYYNPNIFPQEEYAHRVAELKRFVAEFPTKYPVNFVEGAYEPKRFYEAVKGLERKGKAVRVVGNALNFDWARRRKRQGISDATILRRRFR